MPPEDADGPVLDDRLTLITSRRSTAPKRLRPPGPTAGELAAMIDAALTAPDHGSLRPWRIIQVDDRERLADVFVAAKRRREPECPPTLLDREREKARNAPTLLVVCARPRDDRRDIPAHEQLVAVGAAVQNLLLAAHAQGYGASLLSGHKARDPLVRSCLGLLPDEILIGFLSIGSIAEPRSVRPRRDPGGLVTVWTEPAIPLAEFAVAGAAPSARPSW